MKNYLKIKELSKHSGVNQETIRYYEKIGLLAEPQRAANGYRLFDERAVENLEFIRSCRELGFSIDEIRSLMLLRQNPAQDCHNADELVRLHLEQVKQKIAQLYEVQKFLENIGRCEQGEVAKCKVLNSLTA